MSTSHKFRESEAIKTNRAAIQGQTSRKYGLEGGKRLTKELEDALVNCLQDGQRAGLEVSVGCHLSWFVLFICVCALTLYCYAFKDSGSVIGSSGKAFSNP